MVHFILRAHQTNIGWVEKVLFLSFSSVKINRRSGLFGFRVVRESQSRTIAFEFFISVFAVIIMDTKRSYLAGDIHSLAKVNRIVPRKMALPLMMQSSWVDSIAIEEKAKMYRISNFISLTGIQLRRNLFGIRSRFFEHMKSYDYKFKSLGKSERIKFYSPRKRCLHKQNFHQICIIKP